MSVHVADDMMSKTKASYIQSFKQGISLEYSMNSEISLNCFFILRTPKTKYFVKLEY